MFLFFKTQKRPHTASENITFFSKVLRGNVDILNTIFKKHLRYSLFINGIIAIETQLPFLFFFLTIIIIIIIIIMIKCVILT